MNCESDKGTCSLIDGNEVLKAETWTILDFSTALDSARFKIFKKMLDFLLKYTYTGTV